MFPILFEIPLPGGGSIPIYSYGVMLGSSLVIAWYIVMWIGTREGLSRELLGNAFIITAVSAIIGARLLYLITNPHEVESIGDVFALRQGGLVAYGGFLGGFVGAFVYLRQKRVSILSYADVTAPTLALGLMLTRIGCYLYGCDYGARLTPEAPSWLHALGTFPRWADGAGSPAWAHHVESYDLASDASHSFAVHPTQIYESLAGLVLLGGTLLLWRRREFTGQVLLGLAMAYGLWRFAIEYVRDDPERGAAFGFSTSQLISLAIVPVAAFFYYDGVRRRRAAVKQGGAAAIMRLGAPETYAVASASASGERVAPGAAARTPNVRQTGRAQRGQRYVNAFDAIATATTSAGASPPTVQPTAAQPSTAQPSTTKSSTSKPASTNKSGGQPSKKAKKRKKR